MNSPGKCCLHIFGVFLEGGAFFIECPAPSDPREKKQIRIKLLGILRVSFKKIENTENTTENISPSTDCDRITPSLFCLDPRLRQWMYCDNDSKNTSHLGLDLLNIT